jgi:CheY-like chemotaxis protein
MSLILAIEPNKNQAHQLNALVRQYLKAELVTAPTAAAALAALGDRIPDLVLTPALFGLRDEAALTERLRQLGTDGSHVQTLAIPILAAGPSKGNANNTLLGRKRDKADANVGCDPSIFAEQIKIYLQRASVERRAQASEAAARATARPASTASESTADGLSAFMVGADELDVDSLELESIEPPMAIAPEPAQTPDTQYAAQAAEPSVESQDRWSPGPQTATNTTEEESGLVTPPPTGPPLWRAPDQAESFSGNGGSANAASTPKASAESARPAQRPRRTPPRPDEWAYFDPSQTAFKALIRRLDEIAGSAA